MRAGDLSPPPSHVEPRCHLHMLPEPPAAEDRPLHVHPVLEPTWLFRKGHKPLAYLAARLSDLPPASCPAFTGLSSPACPQSNQATLLSPTAQTVSRPDSSKEFIWVDMSHTHTRDIHRLLTFIYLLFSNRSFI